MTLKRLLLVAAGLWLPACAQQPPPAAGRPASLAGIVSPVPTDAAGMQNVTGFDVYVDQQTVHAVFTAAGSDSKRPLIGYLHSEDGGLHWFPPQEIGKQFELPVESKSGNDIQIAASGRRLLVMWQTTGELPGMGPLVTIFSDDGGLSWQRGANPANSDTDQSHPDLAADQQGLFHAVWLDDRDENGYQGLHYARSGDTGKSWGGEQTLDDSTCSCCWNRISISPEGPINVLYRDMQPRDMALAQSTDAGQSWRRISTVGQFDWKFDGCPHNGGGLTQAEQGDLHSVVWTGAENRAGLYHLQSADNGVSWSAPQPIAPGTGAFHSDIAAADKNRLALIWDAMGPEGSAVLLADSGDNGRSWAPAQRISSPGASAGFPRIVAVGSGWLAMWTEQKSGSSRQWLSAIIK
ncbi:MAG: sialidase family protein [Methylococcales bacterium]|nr:sialidase family protein [Methylococcales bacterium]